MKGCFKWVSIIVLVLVIGIFIFLNFFLGNAIKRAILGNYDKFLNAKLELKDLNFSILGGSVDLKGLKIYNPEGFGEGVLYNLDRNKEDLSLMALLKGNIVVEEILIENSNLNIIRNKKGELNIAKLLKEFERKKEPAKEKKKGEKKEVKKEAKEEIALPRFLLEKMLITSAISYMDEKISEKPYKTGFEVKIDAKDISTGGITKKTGILSIRGNLKGFKNECVLDVKLEMPSLVDVNRPSFKLKADIKSVNAKRFSAYKEYTKIEDGMLEINSNIVCNNGKFKKEKSVVKVSIKGLKLTDEFLKENPQFKKLPIDKKIEFSFNIFGSIDNPKTNVNEVFIKILESSIKNAVKSEIKNKATKKLKDKLGGKLGKSKLGSMLGVKSDFNAEKSEDVKESEPEKSSESKDAKDKVKKMLPSTDGLKKLF